MGGMGWSPPISARSPTNRPYLSPAMNRFLPIALLAISVPALANDGAMHDGSRGPEPLEKTESPVRMVAEHIEVEFGAKRSTVHCTFRFRNTQADAPVTQLLGFP